MNLYFHVNKTIFRLNYLYRKYFFYNYHVLSIQETIEFILESDISISRFGDGEIRLISGESIEFQEYSEEISLLLKKVLESDNNKFKVCVVDFFDRLNQYNKSEQYFWKKHLFSYYKVWQKNLTKERKYFNAYITRPYMPFISKEFSKNTFIEFKKLWDNKHVLVVEGELTRFGVVNDLLNNAASVVRILCPKVNAFKKLDEIKNVIKSIYNGHLILLALGPTATILSFQLSNFGMRCIDIGHLDIEYEWFLRNATSKIEIKGKYTNEAVYDKSEIEDCFDQKYTDEILMRIN